MKWTWCLPGWWSMHRPAKVSNFKFPCQPHQQIFWFDVSVNDFLLVAVWHGFEHLQHMLHIINRQWMNEYIIIPVIICSSETDNLSCLYYKHIFMHITIQYNISFISIHQWIMELNCKPCMVHIIQNSRIFFPLNILTVAARFSSKRPCFCNSLYNSPLGAYSRIR